MHHPPHFSHASRSLLLLAAAFLAAGCASKTSLSSAWVDQSARDARYERLLIVGVAASPDTRMTFEDELVDGVQSEAAQAWASSRLMRADREINEAALRELVQSKNADAIVITRVTDIKVEQVEVEGRSNIVEEVQQSGQSYVFERRKGNVFLYEFEEEMEPSRITTEYTTELTTEVFDAVSGAHVYTLVSTARKQQSITDVINTLSTEIADRLRRDRVIR